MNAFADTSTASGLFQFTKDGFKTGLNRVKHTFPELSKSKWLKDAQSGIITVNQLTPTEQQILFFSNIYQQIGTDYYIINIMKGDELSEVILYYKYHHTNPDEATRVRIGKFYNTKIEEEAFLFFKSL